MNFQKDHAPPGIYDGSCTIPKSGFVHVHRGARVSIKLPDSFAIRFFLEHGA
jgi:hypothetical protein